MADAHDPADYTGQAQKQLDLLREQLSDPNKTEFLKTIKRGRRGKLGTEDGWSQTTIRNKARHYRIFTMELRDLDDYPDHVLSLTADQVNEILDEISLTRNWGPGSEANYAMSLRKHFQAHDKESVRHNIEYPATDHQDTPVDTKNVLTREELFLLIHSADHPRDKALLATLWESACRVTAIAALKLRHYKPANEGRYALLHLPGEHVEGLKRAEHGVKPLTFSVGYLDPWVNEHPLSDDPDAPLFCPLRTQDDPSEHLKSHSIYTHLSRLAERTDGVDPDQINPHAFKHGRGTEMRKSEAYGKEDIEQVMDWEDGTPLHQRYEHVEKEDDATRILRKRGIEVENDEPVAEETDCPRCGIKIAAEANYCPRCGLRPNDEPPRWWQAYRSVTTEDDVVRLRYADDLPPASMSELPPEMYSRVSQRLLNALLVHADETLAAQFDIDTSRKLNAEDAKWVYKNISRIADQHRKEHPFELALRKSSMLSEVEAEDEG